MKQFFGILLALLLARERIRCEEISAAAGNPSGESLGVLAADELAAEDARPPAMILNSADRAGSDAIRLFYNYPSGLFPFDEVVCFRAKNDEPWQQVPVTFSGTPGPDTACDANAPAGHDYRYALCVWREQPLLSQYADAKLYSKPSAIQLVSDYRCRPWIFERGTADLLESDTGLTGHVMIPTFVPDVPSAGMNAPLPADPYDFVATANPETVVYSWYSSDSEWNIFRDLIRSGFIRTGVVIQVSGSITGPINGAGETMEPGFSVGYNGTNGFVFSQPFGQRLGNLNGSITWSADSATKFAMHRVEFSGDDTLGYDAASNPPWQMIPLAGAPRDVTATVKPDWAGDRTDPYPLGFLNRIVLTDIPTGDAGDWVRPGNNLRRITPTGTAGSTAIRAHYIGGQLTCDIRRRREIKIKVVNVRVAYPTGASPGNPGDWNAGQWTIGLDPTTAFNLAPVSAIQQELNDTFGKQANVWFTVTEDPIVMIVQDLDGYLTRKEDDVLGKEIRTKADQNRANDDGFFTIFRLWEIADRFDLSVPNLPPVVIRPSEFNQANFIGSPDARFAFIFPFSGPGTYAHEVGHLLGLQHTWIQDPNTPYSEASIPDDARRRVMCYDRYSGSRALIKPERDKIHQTLDALPLPEP